MAGITERAQAFRWAIASFIEERRETKLKGKEGDAGVASKYDYATWLADAARRADNLRMVTHPIKFTHSAIKRATSIRFRPDDWVSRPDIGTHCIGQMLEEDFAVSDAKHLDVYSLLLTVVFEERRLLDWVRLADPDLRCALHDDPTVAEDMLAALQRVLQGEDVSQGEDAIRSSVLAKQVYWLRGTDPIDDGQFDLLQPMFSSSLENAVHRQIKDSISAAFEARGTKKQKPTHVDHHSYPGLVARVLGGSNAQNISPMNKARGGINYLLPSLPPPAWKPSGARLLQRESAFDGVLWFGGMRELVRTLAAFLKADPAPTMKTREGREAIEHDIAHELAMFGAVIRGQYEAGWTRDSDCRLPRCEQLWLDPERSELPPRDDPQHSLWREDDEDFNAAYHHGEWADEVAERFGDWLNAQLHRDGLVAVSLPERNHWASQAIIDVAWPGPMQRRAAGGAA